MSKKAYIVWMLCLLILLVLLLPYFWKIISIIFFNERGIPILTQLSLFKWAAVGFGAYCIFHKYVHKNIDWIETQSHELLHSFVAVLLMRRVHSVVAEEGSGVTWTSGTNNFGRIPMALAPYTLPILTFALLMLRPLMDFHGRWIFDIILGISIGFYFICFKNQIGSYQTDINQYPLSFSYSYIFIVNLINILVITVAFFPDYNIFTSFWRMINSMCDNLSSFLHLVLKII